MFNKVILVGNLTRDIEVRYANNGSAIGNSAIATSRKFSVNGEKREEVCFVDIAFFGRTAEVANQYLKKGSKILVEGRLKFDQWQDQNGNNRSKHSVIVESMQMLGGGQQQQSNSGYGNNTYTPTSNEYNMQQTPAKQETLAKQAKNLQQSENIPEVDVDNNEYDEILPF